MKPSRGLMVWTALAVCAVMVMGAMTWLTRGVLAAGRERERAEHRRSMAESRADIEERTRLALWRMDATGAAIMLRENQTPPDFYQKNAGSSVNPEVLLHFEIREGSALVTPEAGAGAVEERLRQLRALLADHPLPGDEWSLLNGAVIEGESQWLAVPKDAPQEQAFNAAQRQSKSGDELRKEDSYQASNNINERGQRAKAVAQTLDLANAPPQDKAARPGASRHDGPMLEAREKQLMEADSADDKTPVAQPLETGQMRAVWLGGELFLLRRISLSEGGTPPTTSVQGVWLDAKVLGDRLLREAADLLPHARLIPALGESAAKDPLTLVSFPFRLDRNEEPVAAPVMLKPLFGTPLWVAWAAVVTAFVASTLLVSGIMRLSERRASFVSAVTHELRTPLTTFRLYSDMLESGAVKEEKRGDYLRVLAREADRLTHLVENVLAFSRIERGNARSQVRTATTGELLESSRERLEARLATAGLTLAMDSSCTLLVRVDTAAVEHILFNLIDNAAKYAVTGIPPVVTLHARPAGRFVEIVACDHGPGIPPAEQNRIFRAFHKSAREAAESRPGVGLGLALSRRLARSLGGDLLCAPGSYGACFVLRLPLA